MFADGQAEPRAARGARRIGLVEALEHPHQLIGGDAHPSIGDPDLDIGAGAGARPRARPRQVA